ncbi:MAG: NAD-dependent epimerase/dehydratase family protein, partial [Chlorobiales bacterium]|nr:NAD-dependent epimerase/dehydratase family protein [Chlorobiales bacterium]
MATRVKSGTNFWQGKHVLVTGISGFVGPYLARRLVSLGAVVSGTTRNPDEAKKKH